MQTSFSLEIKRLTEEGTFEGIASTYGGEPDLVNDVVDYGAFTKTLAKSREVPLLWNHRDSIGRVELTDSPQGLLAKGVLTRNVRQAEEALLLLKDRAIRGLSIGYTVIKSAYDSAGVRHLQEVRVFEISLTPTPANEHALVTSVKSADLARFQTSLHEFKSAVIRSLEK